MNVIIEKGKACGRISAPPSKSVTHRALICAALSGGESEIRNISYSDDINATINCLEALGAKFCKNDTSITVYGITDFTHQVTKPLECNESGSTLRFMIPICLLFGQKITLKGAKRLFERSLSVYEEIAQNNGFLFEKDDTSVTICGKLDGGIFSVPGNISSQFISGLLFALPFASSKSEIVLTTALESKPYIDITIKALADFGINVEMNENDINILPNQRYVSRDYIVEGDYSNAAFFEALNLIGGDVEIEGLSADSLQGDKIYEQMFKEIKNGFCNLDISNCPDLAPILMTVAAANHGAEFTGTRRLKIKESDRGQAMSDELAKFGIMTEIYENSIKVLPEKIQKPITPICSHNDHRIVMSCAILLTLTGGTIESAEAVNKSFPDFFEILSSLNIGVTNG